MDYSREITIHFNENARLGSHKMTFYDANYKFQGDFLIVLTTGMENVFPLVTIDRIDYKIQKTSKAP